MVTRGGSGLYAVSAGVELRRGAVLIDLVDTVGAGGPFAAGLLDALHRAGLVGGTRHAAIDATTLGGAVRTRLIALIRTKVYDSYRTQPIPLTSRRCS